MRSDAIRPGEVIAGKYRVRAILSRRRGLLVEGFHTEFDQRVVIRVLPTSLVDAKEVERFRREARILAKLESEHVARILDVGTLPDGAFYFVRQYLEGQDLADYQKPRGALPFGEAVLYTLQAAEAVAETNAHDIILRELQPKHLFVTQRLGGQHIKLIDFGTAKLMRDAAAPSPGGELTATSMFGLSCYSSPELIRKAKHVDVRTDVWSLGAILYWLLTGREAFQGEMAALMLAITRDQPVPVSRFRGDVSTDVDNIISWALAKDPDGRFANVHAFAHALLPFGGAEGHMLVKRIGEITGAAKQRQRASRPPPDPTEPITMDDLHVVEDAAPAPSLDQTMFMGNDQALRGAPLGSQALRGAPLDSQALRGAPLDSQALRGAPLDSRAAHRSQPVFAGASASPEPATRGRPVWQPVAVSQTPAVSMGNPGGVPQTPPVSMGNPGGVPQTPPVSMGNPGGVPQTPVSMGNAGAQASPVAQQASAAAPFATMPSAQAPPVAAANGASADAASGRATPTGRRPLDREKKVVAIVGGTVMLLVATLVAVLAHKTTTDETAVASATTEPAHAPAAPESAAAPPEPPATHGPAPSDSAPRDPATPPPTASAVASSPPTAVAANPPDKSTTSRKPSTTATTVVPPPKVKDPPPAPPPSGDNGTLVAVAVGGTCAFSVNGASKGTSSSVKLSVKPGTYSVVCAPSAGASKSKSVTVSSGATAMAMFRL